MRISIVALLLAIGLVAALATRFPPGPLVSYRTVTAGGSSSLNTDLIAFWKMDETSGTRVDSEPTGTPQDLTDNNTVASATGKIVNAGRYVSANSESLTRANSADLSTGDIDFTISAWVVVTTSTNVQRIILSKTESGPGDEYALYMVSSGNFAFFIANGASYRIVTNNTSIVVGNYYHVVCWHNAAGDTVNIRVNDSTTATQSTGGTIPDSGGATFQIGSYRATQYWNGDIDEVGFWKKVLSASEITELYNAGAGKTCCPF